MGRCTCLVVIDIKCDLSRVRRYLQSMPDGSLHLSVMVVGVADAMPIWAYGSARYGPVVIPDDWQARYQAGADAIAARANQVEQVLQDAGVKGDVTTYYREARLLDDRVAARAPHRALPILKQADRVTIATFDPDDADENPGNDAATWLSRHGCNVVVQEYPITGSDVGHSILCWRTDAPGARLMWTAPAPSAAMRSTHAAGSDRSRCRYRRRCRAHQTGAGCISSDRSAAGRCRSW